jgi:sugar/nucleoside kinase (ribokinase family)
MPPETTPGHRIGERKMSQVGSVACVGIYVADALAKPVDEMPERGKLVLFDQLELHTGGCANNTAIALSRLGIPTRALGKIGRDAFGDFVLQRLTEAGVDTEGMIRTDANTSFTFVMVGSDGERTFFHTIGANAELTAADVRLGLIEDAKVLHVAGTFLMPGFDGEPTAELLRWARGRGIVTALDTTWDSSGRWLDTVRDALPHLDFFLPSIEEARAMTGRDDPDDVAQALLDLGAGTVALKLGADGSYVRNADGDIRIPAIPVDAVDTTGAGDAYVGGFLAGQAMGWDLERCGRLGSATGAACVTAIGTTPGLRSLDDTLALWDD